MEAREYETLSMNELVISQENHVALERSNSRTVYSFTGQVADVNRALRSRQRHNNLSSEEQVSDVVSVNDSEAVVDSRLCVQQECRFYIDVEARNDAPLIELKDQRELIIATKMRRSC